MTLRARFKFHRVRIDAEIAGLRIKTGDARNRTSADDIAYTSYLVDHARTGM